MTQQPLITHTYEVMCRDRFGRLTPPYYPGVSDGTRYEFHDTQSARRWIDANAHIYRPHNDRREFVLVRRGYNGPYA